MTIGEPWRMESRTSPQPQRSLKMRRSLSRLISSSSRKLSRSKSPSPTAEDNPPPTPRIPPDYYWPPTPKTANPSTHTHRADEHRVHLTRKAKSLDRKRDYVPVGEEERYNGRGRRRTDAGATEDGQESRRLPAHDAGFVRLDMGKVVPMPPGAHSVHSSPQDSSLPRQKSKTGLRIPPALAPAPRIRRNSLTLYKSKSQPSLPLALKTPTTGFDMKTDKPTGKRRRPGAEQRYDQESPDTPTVESIPSGTPRAWQMSNHGEEFGQTDRTGLTAGSSPVDTASTKRSSILTRRTSITDFTMDPQSRPGSKAGGMTVDDAIDMYVAGFEDGPSNALGTSRDPSMSGGDDYRRSLRIAEAMSDTISSSMPSQRPSTSDSLTSNAIMAGRRLYSETGGPPSLIPPTTLRDQYGFVKATHYTTLTQYDAWHTGYQPHQERRTKKWVSFMREQGLPTYQPTRFPTRSAKTQRYILKGVPPAWRGAVWFHYAGGDTFLHQHPSLYEQLVSRSDTVLHDSEKDSIERDLHRTFPDNLHFKPTMTGLHLGEPPLVRSLRRVLRAFAVHAPKIGYCQSLNFLAGLLLLFLSEEKAFVMLHIITTDFLPNTHSMNLEGANVDLWVMMLALKSALPDVWAAIGLPSTSPASSPQIDPTTTKPKPRSPTTTSSPPPISLCTTSWFMSLFISVLPIETTLRIWDSLFYDGPRTLFRAAIGVFRLGEKRITSVASHGAQSDNAELFQAVQSLPKGMLDASNLMKIVARKDGVTGTWVGEKRRLVASQRETEKGRHAEPIQTGGKEKDLPALPPPTDVDLNHSSNQPNSLWRHQSQAQRLRGLVG